VTRGYITSVVAVASVALVFAGEAMARPTVDFAVAPTPVVAGEQATFTSNSAPGVGEIIDTVWDLDGDRTFGEVGETGTPVENTFPDAGTFNVTLRVTDGDQVPVDLTREIVVEPPPPVADFMVSPVQPFALEPAMFRSTSDTVDGETIADKDIQWDFGDDDGNDNVFDLDASGPNPSPRTFPSVGSYRVHLVVTDSRGETDDEIRNVDVNAPRFPTAAFTWSPNPPTVGAPATFTSNSMAIPGFPISTAWSIDGASAGNAQTATHTFTSPGNHTVRLVVDDARALAPVELPQTLYVNARPDADFSAFPGSPLVGEEVNLTSDSSDDGPLTEQVWDLNGDGVFGGPGDARGSRAMVMFGEPGNHTISLRVTDGYGAESTISRTINVRRSSLLQPISNRGDSGPSVGIAQPVLRLISPFPVVRLTGSVVKRGTRIRRLSVRAPAGSRVFVRCRGRGCPVKRVIKLVKRSTVRFPAFERLMRAGTLLEVLVRRGDRMGKYTSFRIRRKRVPKRIDGCLPPSASRGVTCQAD
jgi:PKD repeat protein